MKSASHFGALFLFGLLFSSQSFGQAKDSLVMKNKNVLVGEIKSMEKGVLIFETPYSDKDFQIEWHGLEEIYSSTMFFLTLKDGRRFIGTVRSVPGSNHFTIYANNGQEIPCTFDELVYVKALQSSFWGRMNANVDVGINIAKANKLRQYSMRSSFSYLANSWQLDGYFNANISQQDSVTDIRRTEGGLSNKFFLNKDWFQFTSLTFLSNTEQALKLRSAAKVGMGKMFIHTNSKYWGTGIGFSLLNEQFNNEVANRNSAELYAGSELNLFDIGDLNLLSSVYVYTGLTEKGRWRCDFKLDAKYDLPLDFYLKPGITVNYDNRPAVAGKELDFVFVFNIGWELD